MFKSTRWKSQNSKTKVMFQMQFQATQVPKLKGKGLMISLIPADVGKPTARLGKTAVVEGTCTWEHPIYEMVKLIKHQKTETYKEKVYYFNVATGSSKAGFLGEVGVNFADFAEATEPFQISLPLTASDSGAILHVFIQKLQRTDEVREFEENESPGAESLRFKNQTSDCSENGNILDFTEDDYSVKSQNIRDPQPENNPNLQEHSTVRRNSTPLNNTVDALPEENHVQQRSSLDWSLGSLSDRSMADVLNSPQHTYQINRLPEASNNAIEVLKRDICRLERQAEVSEMELESLRKQIVKENKRGQDLSRQIVELKEEKYALKTECDLLKSSREAVRNQSESSEDLRVLLDEIRQELKHEKSSKKALRLQLQKTEESNSELCLLVKDLDKTMEQKDAEISYLSNKVKESQMVKEAMACKRECEEQERNTKDFTTKQKIEDLYAEIELYKKDKEEMKSHMKNISLEYEFLQQEKDNLSSKLEQTQIEQMKTQSEYSKSLATIKEYELQVERLEEKITKQALIFSESLDTISELETHVKSLETELDKQAHDFEDELEALMKAKVEQEQRVIQVEEALKKTRLTNATTTEHLQKELRRLSVEMASTLDVNEKLTSEAIAEAAFLRQQTRDLKEALKKSHEELSLTKDLYEQEIQKLCDQTNRQAEQIEQISLEFEEKRSELETVKKHGGNDWDIAKDAEGKIPQEWIREREELETESASLKKEAEKLQVEATTWKNLMEEKKVIIGTLQLKLKTLRGDYSELQQSLMVMEFEKDNLREEVSRLEHNLREKENATTTMDQPKHFNLRKEGQVVCDVNITTSKHAGRVNTGESILPLEISTTKLNLNESRSVLVSAKRNEGNCSEKELSAPTSHHSDEHKINTLLSEISSLDGRNKHMESELKEMQEKYLEISLRFAEVEGERQQLVMTLRNLRNGKKK